VQPKREFDSNKRKQMKINDSKIAFFYLRLFFRIGTFQWVAPDSNRIFSPFIWSSRWLYWRGAHSPVAPRRGRRASAIEFGIAVDLNQDFGFAQENVGEHGIIRARQPRFERQ
jgi:hypothetical protein